MQPEFDVDVVVVAYSGELWKCLRSGWEKNGGDNQGLRVRYTTIDNRPVRSAEEQRTQSHPCGMEQDRYIPDVLDSYRFRENLGWVKGANVGLALSTAPYVVLMNDDCEVKTDGWLERLSSGLQNTDGRIAACGPRNACRAAYQGDLDPLGKELSICTPQLSLRGFGIGDLPLSFSCVMFSRPALEEIGYLDERLGHGYGGDDDDWQARAHLAGWQLAVHPQVEVIHQGGASWHGEAKAQAQAKNVKILREMWRKRLS